MCNYILSYLKLNTKTIQSYNINKVDKRIAILLWIEFVLTFLFAYIEILKPFVRIMIILFQLTAIIGYLRYSFLKYYRVESQNKLLGYLLCFSIIVITIGFIITVYSFI